MKILTFDIEDWFHILDNESTRTEKEWHNYESRIHSNMDKIFELLDQSGHKATFFCLGWIARKYPDVIQKINNLGYEIATHSDLHQLAYTQSRAEFEKDLEMSVKSLEDITGKKITAYRAPGFSFKSTNKWAFESLLKFGIETDCSIFPARRAHGGFPEFGQSKPCWIDIDGMRMKEFPINLKFFGNSPMIFSGGGYFRLLPLKILHRFFDDSNYVMTYFHPRDFDGDQPVIENLSILRKFKSYYGLKKCKQKLHMILENYSFLDLQAANKLIDWDKAEVVSLH